MSQQNCGGNAPPKDQAGQGRDGETQKGPLWFQRHTRRRLLRMPQDGRMQAVPLTKDIRMRVNVFPRSPTETDHASRP